MGATPWVLRAIDALSKVMNLQKQSTTPATRNPYRIKASQALKEEGFDGHEGIEVFSRQVLWDGECRACCSEGCMVEPDGCCHHGCPSILLALGMI